MKPITENDDVAELHPAVYGPIAGDNDGDTLSIWVVLTEGGGEETRARLGVQEQQRKAGDGSTLVDPTHSAKEGLTWGIERNETDLRQRLEARLEGDNEAKGALARAWPAQGGTPLKRIAALAAGLASDQATGGAIRATEALWSEGLRQGQNYAPTITLTEYEAFGRIAQYAREHDPKLAKTPAPVPLSKDPSHEQRQEFAEKAWKRQQAWRNWISEFVKKPNAMDPIAAKAGLDKDTTAQAKNVILALAHGARIKVEG